MRRARPVEEYVAPAKDALLIRINDKHNNGLETDNQQE